jgi:ABC-type glutathione transport system ATPase component
MLEVHNLKSYIQDKSTGETTKIVNGVSFSVNAGETLGIFGVSGSGKTFTMLSILGVISGYPGVVGGKIIFQGCDLLNGISDICDIDEVKQKYKKNIRKWNKIYLYEKKMREIRGRKIVFVPQEAKTWLWPFGTINEQLQEAYAIGGGDIEKKDDTIEKLLKRLCIIKYKDKYPHELSGGACRRLILGIALVLNPNIIIADEVTTELDPILKQEIIAVLKDFLSENKDLGFAEKQRALIIISHDVELMKQLADKIVVIREGKVVESGSIEIITKNKAKDQYTRKLIEDADIDKAMKKEGMPCQKTEF